MTTTTTHDRVFEPHALELDAAVRDDARPGVAEP
jgi:hypothetical protein